MKRILIIEDDPNLRSNLNTILRLNEYEVATAEDGASGIKAALDGKPDLIVCDIMLPDIDGYEILERLRNEAATRLTPFIFLTAKSGMENLRKGMNLGADDYLVKPVKTEELLEVIKLRLERSSLMVRGADVHETNLPEKFDEDEKILFESGKKVTTLELHDIVCILSEGVYSQVFLTGERHFLFRRLLKEWEESLPAKGFLRIHRSAIINAQMITSIEKQNNGTYCIFLKDFKEPIFSSIRYSHKLREKIFH